VALSALGLAVFLGFVLRSNGISLVGDPNELTLFTTAFRPSEKILAIVAIVLFTVLSARVIVRRSRIRLTVLKIVLVALFIGLGLAAAVTHGDPGRLTEPGGGDLEGLILAMGITFIAFEGYEAIATSSESVRNRGRNVPRGIFLAFSIVLVTYVLLFVAALLGTAGVPETCTFAWECLAAPIEPELGLVRATLTTGLLDPLPLVVLLTGGIVATAVGVFLNAASSTRTAVLLSRDAALPSNLGHLMRDGRTPLNALLVSTAIAVLLVLVLDIFQLALTSAIFFLLLFALVDISLIAHRRSHPDVVRPFRVPLVPVLPALAAGLNIALAGFLWTFPPLPVNAIAGPGVIAWYVVLLWLGLGLMYHYFAGGRSALEQEAWTEMEDPIDEEPPRGDHYTVLLPMKSFEDETLVHLSAKLARAHKGELSLLNVVEVPPNIPPRALKFSFVDARIRGLQKLSREARRDDVVDVTAEVKIGTKPYKIVLHTVEEAQADLIVVGWPEDAGGRPPTGSNIGYLLQQASCDVALIRTAGLTEAPSHIGLVVAGAVPQHLVDVAAALAAPEGRVVVLGVSKTHEDPDVIRVLDRLADRQAVMEYREVPASGETRLPTTAVADVELILVAVPPARSLRTLPTLLRQVAAQRLPVVFFREAT
jgi:amino acid transporter/nucleotide-binding universal stress UspA family protein